jgi:V/A-type H+-transporting ATPase subunit F
VIITTEKIGIEFRDTINKLTNERALPMVIEIPDKSGSIKRESDPMSELIKRVIGVEMVK